VVLILFFLCMVATIYSIILAMDELDQWYYSQPVRELT
jgi:hypothetical protein